MYSATKTHALSLAITILSIISSTEADTTTCQPGWEWLYNSKGQSPCQTAGLLQADCMGYNGYVLPPLAPGTKYLPPTAEDERGKRCGCNTIIYSLYMACTACQNSTFGAWSHWGRECDSVHATVYPLSIPPGAVVPHWAYLDYTKGDWFDPNLAKVAGRDPEATPTVPSSVPLPSSTAPRPSSILSTPPKIEYAGSDIECRHKVGIGAIVGGVVGGVTVLAIFAVCVLGLLKRRRIRQAQASVFDSNQKVEYGIETTVPEDEQQKLYDPTDPFTYPTVSVEDGPAWDSTPTTLQWPGRYNGTAEL